MQGSVDAILTTNEALAADVAKEQRALEQNVESEIKTLDSSEKLIVSEELKEGMVKWPTCKSRLPGVFLAITWTF